MNREQLMDMPISRLRSLDIRSQEDELLVQEVLNEKLQNEPNLDINRAVLSSRETDGLTPEKEKELQARLDNETDIEVSASEPVILTTEPVTSSEKKSFCEFCLAKGPVKHMGNCTRLSANNIIT